MPTVGELELKATEVVPGIISLFASSGGCEKDDENPDDCDRCDDCFRNCIDNCYDPECQRADD